jgi:hypothetical protein
MMLPDYPSIILLSIVGSGDIICFNVHRAWCDIVDFIYSIGV